MTLPGHHFNGLTCGMFFREEAQLAVSFTVAEARLADLARRGWLLTASEVAYGAGAAGLEGFGAPGSAPTMSRLVRVHLRAMIARRDSAGLALRWEAAGPGGGLFPALDADILLSPAGQQTTTLVLAGVYRVPSANVGDGLGLPILRRMGQETIRTFGDLIAAAITAPVPAEERNSGPADGGACWPPAFQAP
jgi:hypothetical protein